MKKSDLLLLVLMGAAAYFLWTRTSGPNGPATGGNVVFTDGTMAPFASLSITTGADGSLQFTQGGQFYTLQKTADGQLFADSAGNYHAITLAQSSLQSS